MVKSTPGRSTLSDKAEGKILFENGDKTILACQNSGNSFHNAEYSRLSPLRCVSIRSAQSCSACGQEKMACIHWTYITVTS